MISPTPIERYVEIARAFGSRTRPLDEVAHRSLLRRLRRQGTVADGIRVPITIREAVAQDRPALTRLAALDGHRLPAGPQIVAVADGRILAAAEVTTGATIADPFKPSAGVATLVSLRARQLRRDLAA
jgi:hypothetical protein